MLMGPLVRSIFSYPDICAERLFIERKERTVIIVHLDSSV